MAKEYIINVSNVALVKVTFKWQRYGSHIGAKEMIEKNICC